MHGASLEETKHKLLRVLSPSGVTQDVLNSSINECDHACEMSTKEVL